MSFALYLIYSSLLSFSFLLSKQTMEHQDAQLYIEIEKYSKLGTLDGYAKAFKVSQSIGAHGYIQRACAFNLGAKQIELQKYEEGLNSLTEAVSISIIKIQPDVGEKKEKKKGKFVFIESNYCCCLCCSFLKNI